METSYSSKICYDYNLESYYFAYNNVVIILLSSWVYLVSSAINIKLPKINPSKFGFPDCSMQKR